MKRILRNINLITNFSTEIPLEKGVFVQRLQQHVDDDRIGLFFDIFDAFSMSKNEYKGQINQQNFIIKRRKFFFDGNFNLAVAKGVCRQGGESTIIEAEINGFTGFMIPLIIIALAGYAIIFSVFFVGNLNDGRMFIPLLLLVFHATFIMSMMYRSMRRGIKRMAYELEREFYYMAKPDNL